MNLIRPTKLSQSAISIIKSTAAVVAPKAEEISTKFYQNMFTSNPEVLQFFNKSNNASSKQPRALAHAVIAYASHIDNLAVLTPAVQAMSVKHCGLQVQPSHYAIVEQSMMQTIGEVLGDAVTPEVADGWSEALQFLSGVLIANEQQLQEDAAGRRGGWRGWKQCRVGKQMIAQDAVLLTLHPEGQTGPIDFTPGQFLTLRTNSGAVEAPRHQTIVSAPGEPYLQCAVKNIRGEMSSQVHQTLQDGGFVEVSPPFGLLSAEPKDSVLIGAGIGITAMVALQKQLGSQVKKIYHVDRDKDHHAFRELQLRAKCEQEFQYTSQMDRPDLKKMAEEIFRDNSNANVYICGPESFMTELKKQLKIVGIENIFQESFGPKLKSD